MHLAGIEAHLVTHTKVCAFARPGAGGSDRPASLPRAVEDVVAEVHDVLVAAGIEPPYFLVGQSAGAAITFMFAQAYSDEVAGFVFMNGNPPYETWVAEAPGLGVPQAMIDGAIADFSGNNPEQIDFRSNESMLRTALPATMPFAIMYDECGDGPECPFAGEAVIFERLAGMGEGGRFVWAKGAGHEIHLTDPNLVYDTIDKIWAEAND
jgi:pimeloyl-ACP methyl ester carboxylesterase